MNKTDISAVILTKNEERNIKRCLLSVAFCDEVLVVDDNSIDKTVSLARKAGARVLGHLLKGNYARQKNWALTKAKNHWVLFVDADEVVSKELKKEISKRVSEDTDVNGYLIKRRDFLFGKPLKYGEVGGVSFVKLARRGKGIWKRSVHEQWQIKGEVGSLTNYLYHFPHQTLEEFSEHVNFQSTLHAGANLKEGKSANFLKIIFFPIGKFISGYLFKLGFLDGYPGLVLAGMMSIHSFLSWIKLWQLQKGR